MKLALCIIAKGEDSEVAPLKRCLDLIWPYMDGIFVTVTHKPGQEASKEMLAMLNEKRVHVSEYEWTYHFANARNYNFSQVPTDYTHILWLDADDGLRGAEHLKATIEAHPDVDAFVFNYLYAFDEHKNPVVVHLKTQVVKNDGCVIWRGQLHEDFEPTRQLKTFFVKGIERIHLSTEERFNDSKVRNVEVAEKNVEQDPDDPRSYWNLGNSLHSIGRYPEAIKAFDLFLEKTQSDEERYIARLRRAECYWQTNRKPLAIDECRYAIGTRPDYPDAYHLAGNLFLESQRFDEAVQMYLAGMTKKPPYTKILVYNPREYDYVPLKNLAKAFYAISRPDQALICLKQCLKIIPNDSDTKRLVKVIEKESKLFDEVVKEVARIGKFKSKARMKTALAKLSPEMQSHPAVCNLRNVHFVKEESSGKDIVFYCGPTNEIWNPETAKTKGIGGSEEAVIWISRLLSERGWNVEVYANCGLEPKKYGDVMWKPHWMWNYRDRQDAVVIWRHPQLTKYEINAPRVYVDLHDVIQEGEFTPDRLRRITKIFVKSKFHRFLLPTIPDEKFVIIPNGIDPKVFESNVTRDPMLMVNTSSADRSLSSLLDCYAEIKKQVPEAKLKWAYGWGVWDFANSSDQKKTEWKAMIQARMKELGVEELGRLSHGEIAKLYLQANIFAYPSEFAEIDCISLSKAMASGAVPITTDFAAMGEKKAHGGVFIHSDKTKDDWAKAYQFDFSLHDEEKKKEFVANAIRFLKTPPSEDARNSMREWARFTFDWNRIADEWNNALQ